MRRRAAIAALFLPAILQAVPQDASPGPLTLKSASHAVQLDVFVSDSSGRPVHGLQKSDFVVTDNGLPRDIRIFSGEIGANQKTTSSAGMVPQGMYSNRLGMRDAPIVTSMVIDATPRPEGLQKNPGMFPSNRPNFWFALVRGQAISAIHRMEPGQTMAIYASCPELRVIQDFTSDPERLAASLKAFVPPRVPDANNRPRTVAALVPPLLSVLRDVVGRMGGAAGRKSVVWISQAYGTELKLSAISDATDSTIAAFNDANVPLYAVDTRFNPTCMGPSGPVDSPVGGRFDPTNVGTLSCSQPPDISDKWMEYLARSTGGRAFSGGKISGFRSYDPQTRTGWGHYELQSDHGLVSDALQFADDESRYAYEVGFYVPEPELDGRIHRLGVTLPGKPQLVLRYRNGYTASSNATAPPDAQGMTAPDSSQQPARPLNADELGIDARIDMAAKNELRVSLALTPKMLGRSADGVVLLDVTFTQTDGSGKQLSRVQETVPAPAPETQSDMVRYSRTLKLSNGAALLHVRIRDQATNRAGSLAIPIGKQ